MKKKIQLLFLCIVCGSSYAHTKQLGHKTIAIDYVKPYEYVQDNNNLLIKALEHRPTIPLKRF